MFQFNIKCFSLSALLFLVLVYIALFVNDAFVRPFLGDVLVVCWLYLFLKSFVCIQSTKLALLVLLFAYIIEIAQFYNLVTVLGLENNKAARIIIGSTFDWRDLLAYTLGWSLIMMVECYRSRLSQRSK